MTTKKLKGINQIVNKNKDHILQHFIAKETMDILIDNFPEWNMQ